MNVFMNVLAFAILSFSGYTYCAAQDENDFTQATTISETTTLLEELYPTTSSSQSVSESKIQRGLRDLRLRILKQRAEMVLSHLEESAPEVLAIQEKIEALLEKNANSLDDAVFPAKFRETMWALINVEDTVLPKEKLDELQSTILATSLRTLRTSPYFYHGFLGPMPRMREHRLPNLQEVLQAIPGGSLAVQIKNLVDGQWTISKTSIKGAYLVEEAGPTVLSHQAKKVYGFSLVEGKSNKLAYIYQLKSSPIAFVLLINREKKAFTVAMNFLRSEDLSFQSKIVAKTTSLQTSEAKSSDGSSKLDTAQGRINKSFEGFDLEATVEMRRTPFNKFAVSITLQKWYNHNNTAPLMK